MLTEWKRECNVFYWEAVDVKKTRSGYNAGCNEKKKRQTNIQAKIHEQWW